ncbi:MAG: 2-C-methyl-D-erythritol 4-phosphate cytidylyltransferase [Actinomycetia bacterium]|nr:2-C-methyl-D-erythritol 4-phosphate cytidylyltransferase [Actinomycetes bacterium]
MMVRAILPVPVGFAERRDAVFTSVAGISPLARVVRALGSRCDVVVAVAGPLFDAVREVLGAEQYSMVRVVLAEPPGERAQCLAAGLQGLAGGAGAVVHDLAWPLVGAATVDRIVATLRSGAVAVMPAGAVTDSVKVVSAEGLLTGTLDRSQLRRVQFPRGFDADLLAGLVKRSESGPFDELEAVLSAGTPLTLIDCDEEALGVELPRDADYLAAVIEGRQDLSGQRHDRAGPGEDVARQRHPGDTSP